MIFELWHLVVATGLGFMGGIGLGLALAVDKDDALEIEYDRLGEEWLDIVGEEDHIGEGEIE